LQSVWFFFLPPTGEYIRLPLDELLNDVLQLSQFPLEDDEVSIF